MMQVTDSGSLNYFSIAPMREASSEVVNEISHRKTYQQVRKM